MLSILAMRPQEMEKVVNFPYWDDPQFVFIFFLASAMGSILNYSIFLCTMNNSALTTTVVGCLKNVLTAYMGMLFLKDYVFSLENFVGLNISIFGSLIYSWAEFREIMKKRTNGSGVKGNGSSGGAATVRRRKSCKLTVLLLGKIQTYTLTYPYLPFVVQQLRPSKDLEKASAASTSRQNLLKERGLETPPSGR